MIKKTYSEARKGVQINKIEIYMLKCVGPSPYLHCAQAADRWVRSV